MIHIIIIIFLGSLTERSRAKEEKNLTYNFSFLLVVLCYFAISFSQLKLFKLKYFHEKLDTHNTKQKIIFMVMNIALYTKKDTCITLEKEVLGEQKKKLNKTVIKSLYRDKFRNH